MTINAAAIAESWNEPIPELHGTPLSKNERGYALGRAYDLRVKLKEGTPKNFRIDGNRKVDAIMEMLVTADDEGWDHLITNIDVQDVTEKFE